MTDRKLSCLPEAIIGKASSYSSVRDRVSLGNTSKENQRIINKDKSWKDDAKRYFRKTIKDCANAKEQYHYIYNEAILQFKARYREYLLMRGGLYEDSDTLNAMYDVIRETHGAIAYDNILEYISALGHDMHSIRVLTQDQILRLYTDCLRLEREIAESKEERSVFVDTISNEYPYFRILYDEGLKRARLSGISIRNASFDLNSSLFESASGIILGLDEERPDRRAINFEEGICSIRLL